jgi:hypothetical protein
VNQNSLQRNSPVTYQENRAAVGSFMQSAVGVTACAKRGVRGRTCFGFASRISQKFVRVCWLSPKNLVHLLN